MARGFLGLWMLVLAVPFVAGADPEDPPPPDKPGTVQPVAAQEPAATPAAPAMEAPAPTAGSVRQPAPNLIDDHVGPTEHVWVEADYLLWWIKHAPLPVPLLTTGSQENGGVLGAADTRVLLGNSSIDFSRISGVQVAGGGWLDERHIWGLESSGFLLERRSVTASFASDVNGNPVLARPFNDALADFAPDVVTVAFPGAFAGSFSLSSSSRLWGLEANVDRNLYASPRFRADLLLGFHYFDLDEKLTLLQQTQALEQGQLFFLADVVNATPNGVPVTAETILDSFHTRNQVYAGQLGMRMEGHFGAGFVSVTGKVGFGPNHETVSIAGSTTATFVNGTTQTAPGGLLALAGTNIGRANNNPFVIVPQVDVRIGYQLATWLQLFVGYDFLFINEVVRPGSQISLNVNTGLLPSHPNFGSAIGPNEPSRTSKTDDFWAQGINFGIELRY
jgi:hypothetical protein